LDDALVDGDDEADEGYEGNGGYKGGLTHGAPR
jgi:hypothetical protein